MIQKTHHAKSVLMRHGGLDNRPLRMQGTKITYTCIHPYTFLYARIQMLHYLCQMIQNQDAPTKIISCRVPMQEYIRFLTEASGKGMSISNWLLMKIYTKESEKVPQEASKTPSKALDALRRENEKLRHENQELKLDVAALKETEEKFYKPLSSTVALLSENIARGNQNVILEHDDKLYVSLSAINSAFGWEYFEREDD